MPTGGKADAKSGASNSKIRALESKRESLFVLVQKLVDSSKTIVSEEDRRSFLVRTQTLQQTRSDYERVLDELVVARLDFNPDYAPSHDGLEVLNDLICEIMFVREELQGQVKAEPASRGTARSALRLPPIELIKFQGNPAEFSTFSQLFKRIVDSNSSLTDDDRAHYLFTHVVGPAASTIAGIAPIGQNYRLAWQLLESKYEDKRCLANSYFSKLLNFKALSAHDTKNLNRFTDEFEASVSALKLMNLNDLSDFLFTHLALSKLESYTLNRFEQSHSMDFPRFSDLTEFIRRQTKILSRSEAFTSRVSASGRSPIATSKSHALVSNAQANSSTCESCKGNHFIYRCREFLALRVEERIKRIKALKLCRNCLRKHAPGVCPSKGSCFKCGKKHNTILHISGTESQGSGKVAVTAPVGGTHCSGGLAPASCAVGVRQGSRVAGGFLSLSPTALVWINGGVRRKARTARVLLDSGANCNLISAESCRRHGLHINTCPSVAYGLGDMAQQVLGRTSFTVTSRIDSRFSYPMTALVVERLVSNLPAVSIAFELTGVLRSLPLADESCFESGPVDCIFGASLVARVLGNRKVRVAGSDLFSIESTLGNILMGELPASIGAPVAMYASVSAESDLHRLVQDFWTLDSVPCRKHLSPEESACEKDFERNVSRLENGSFSVGLPFKDDPALLGNSRNMAERRLLSLEKRLSVDLSVREGYNTTFREYLDRGYLHRIADPPASELAYYIPHRAVYRPDKSTSKIRLVLDASSKSTSGKSLNDILHSGPNIQSNIFALLTNFRLFRVALSADIEKMYFSIKVHPDHRRFLRVLYRFNAEDHIGTYEFSSLPMGLTSACYLAVRVLKRLFRDESSSDLRSLLESSTCTYMDDYLLSVQTSEEAVRVKRRLVELHARAGFRLAKWQSNSSDVLCDDDVSSDGSHLIALDADPHSKLVGLWWDSKADLFFFKIADPDLLKPCTKRHMLSVTASLYDPLGFLSPIISGLKCMIQECWKLGVNWDEPVPSVLSAAWVEIYRELPLLSRLRIPRHLGLADGVKVHLLGFADASEKCMGAVIYARSGDLSDMAVSVSFVCAKSKVAPLKRVTLARLELCAAHVLALLYRAVSEEIGERGVAVDVLAFSDSTVALSWICSSPHRWHTFVANRTSEIQDILPAERWFHVPGSLNPSDLITRPVSPSLLNKNEFWFAGPEWVALPSSQWPAVRFSSPPVDSDLPEAKSLGLLVKEVVHSHPLEELIARTSSWNRLRRSVVFILRFINRLSSRGAVTSLDITAAEKYIVMHVQRSCLASDLTALKKGLVCSRPVRRLAPFLSDGLMRVGGRLRHSDLEYNHKHPILLPSKHRVTELIVSHAHVENFHTGPGLLLAILRRDYWILSARGLVRRIVHACNPCFKSRPKPTFPLMGDLPRLRFGEIKAFANAGVDYAGPIFIRSHRGRNPKTLKAYICLFVCLATKAVHLELVSDLSTDLFLAAFNRFIARRGPVSVILSDGGRNFIGAKRKLSEIYALVSSTEYAGEIIRELAPRKIEFKINPPLAPHHGGIWEANIKCVKSHLFRVIGKQVLSYEELNTLLIQIEAILNSRPLCVLSPDPSEPSALTPAHFLTIQPLAHFPATDLREVPVERVQRFALVDKLIQSYWDRWRLEYLTSLQTREKWNVSDRPLLVGQVVLLKEPNVPTLCWPMGVISEVFPGSDGISRVARVRTRAGSYVRPATRICPLPTQ